MAVSCSSRPARKLNSLKPKILTARKSAPVIRESATHKLVTLRHSQTAKNFVALSAEQIVISVFFSGTMKFTWKCCYWSDELRDYDFGFGRNCNATKCLRGSLQWRIVPCVSDRFFLAQRPPGPPGLVCSRDSSEAGLDCRHSFSLPGLPGRTFKVGIVSPRQKALPGTMAAARPSPATGSPNTHFHWSLR